jgi:hypothetical protein
MHHHSQNSPNLFDEAPGELTQDAFLCWIFKWLNVPDHPMNTAARRFAEGILSKVGISVDWSEFERVDVRRQFRHIDVLVVFSFKMRPRMCLVIEDKINARFSNDVEQYKRDAISQQESWSPLKGIDSQSMFTILIQSGFDYDLPAGENWAKFNWCDLWHWIQDVPVFESDILRDWTAYQTRSFERIDCLCRLASDKIDDVLRKSSPKRLSDNK